MKKKKITDALINKVFANREDYDRKRYIQREQYEIDLKRALDRYRYVFVTGESGSGKTWLTKYYLSNKKIKNEYINLSEVALLGGLLNYIKKTYDSIRTEETATVDGKLNAGVFSVKGDMTTTYEVSDYYLWDFLERNQNSVVVLDNFEAIIDNPQILSDVGCLITLADDPRMIEYNPHFLIIGALSNMIKYFQKMPNYQTIANRVTYVSINGFTDTETWDFVNKGITECGFTTSTIHELSMKVYKSTNGFPQAVNDLCYYIAMEHFDRGEEQIVVDSDTVNIAELNWVRARMMAEYSVINGYFIENINKNPLFNFVLFSLKDFDLREFSTSQIRANSETAMGDGSRSLAVSKVKTYLDRLADESENRNILIRTNADGYKIKSYKTKACLSTILSISDGEVRCVDSMDCLV